MPLEFRSEPQPERPKAFSPFSLAFFLLLAAVFCAGEILAKDATMPPPPNEKEHTDIPRYSLLFDEARRLQREGKPLEALKTVEAVYGCEVPVQAFYDTLDRFKIRVMGHIDDEFSIRAGHETYTINDLKTFFLQVLLLLLD